MSLIKHHQFIFCLLPVMLCGCLSNNKQTTANILPISIYKQWQFKKMDAASSAANHNSKVWIGNNILDMRNKDTLRFSYGGMHNKPTSYPYIIQHDTIFIQNKPGYTIVKLTDSALYIMAIFNQSNIDGDSNIMIYKTK